MARDPIEEEKPAEQPQQQPQQQPGSGGAISNLIGSALQGAAGMVPQIAQEAGRIAEEHEAMQQAALTSPVYQGPVQPWSEQDLAALPSPYEIVGNAAYAPTWTTAPLVPRDESTFQDIALTMQQIDSENPLLVLDILRFGWGLMAAPEMIANSRAQLGLDNGEAIAMMESLIPDLPDYAQESVDQALQDSPLVADFFTETRHFWRTEEREFMMAVLASLPADGGFGYRPRDVVVALARQWLAGSANSEIGGLWQGTDMTVTQGTERDMSDPNVRSQFLSRFYQWARQQQQEWLGRQSGLGKFGAQLARPANFIARSLNDIIYSNVTDPADWAWREPLSLGQNIATSFGIDPGDGWAWHLTSGAIDGFSQVVLDPINLLAGWGVGAKMSKTFAAIGDFANLPRWQRVLRASLPFVGKHYTRLPRFNRNFAARVMWAIKSQPEEVFIRTARENGVFRHMYNVLNSPGGIAEFLDFYPSYAPIADVFVRDVLAKCPTAEWVEEAVVLATRGQFTLGETGTEGIAFLNRLAQASGDQYHVLVREGLSSGAVAPHTLQATEHFGSQAYIVGNHIGARAPATGELPEAPGTYRFSYRRNNNFAAQPIAPGDILWDATHPNGVLYRPDESNALAMEHFGPPRPTAYDGSPVVVLPRDWKPTAVLGEGVVPGVAEGVAHRGMGDLFDWLALHPDYHAVPEATTVVARASELLVPRGSRLVRIADAMLEGLPEHIKPEWVSAFWMHRNGISLAEIAKHFHVARSTISRRIAQAEAALTTEAGTAPGLWNVFTNTRLTDMNESRRIGGVDHYHYRTAEGFDIWTRNDLGVTRAPMAYEQMSAPTRLHMLLRDLYTGTVQGAQRGPNTVAHMSDILARTLADPEIAGLLLRYADHLGLDIDELRLITRLIPGDEATYEARIITGHGASRVQPAKMVTQQDAPAVKYPIAFQEMRNQEALLTRIKAGGSKTLWIKDFPLEVPSLRGKRLWRAHASNDAQGWWAYQRRLISAKFFNPRYRPVFNLNDAQDAAHSLGVFLRRLGVRDSFIQRWVNRVINADPSDRMEVLRLCVQEVSNEIDHPLFKIGLVQYVERQGVRTYATIADIGTNNFVELGLAKTRSGIGNKVPVPWLPSHMSAYAVLPNEEFFKSLSRWRQARRWRRIRPGAISDTKRGFITGYTKKTRDARKSLATEYKNRVQAAIKRGELQDIGKISDEDYMAMAYATAFRKGGEKGGTGRVAQVGRALSHVYNVFHSMFSVAQLALRPIAWSTRVLLEEQFRGAFFDYPTLARNPFRMLSAWHGEYLVSMASRWQTRNQKLLNQILQDMWATVPKNPGPEDYLDAARRIVPDIDRLLVGKRLGTPERVKAAVAHVLSQSFIEECNVDLLRGSRFVTRRAVRRTTRSRIARERMREMGLEVDFTWEKNASEIRNVGFAQRYIEDVAASGSLPVQFSEYGMTLEQSRRYGVALGRSMWQLANDPILGGFGLKRILLGMVGHGDMGSVDARALTHSVWWTDVRRNVHRIVSSLAEEGDSTAVRALITDTELADWYLTHMVDPYAEYMFGWLYKGRPSDEQVRIVTALAGNEPFSVQIGSSMYDLHLASAHETKFTEQVKRIINEQSMLDDVKHVLPPTVTSHWDARFLYDDTTETVTGAVKATARTIMAIAGDWASQVVNRRPAYLDQFRSFYHYYRDRGFAHQAAQQAAHSQAVQAVNYVYYNMENAVPFLRAMNKVSPFFTAAWEVAQTWAYKIPAIYGWPIGIPVMIRKVDRFINALIKVGILQVDPDEDPSSPSQTHQLRLTFGPNPNTGNPFGDVMSRGLYALLATPTTIGQHIPLIRNILGSVTDMGDAARDVWQIPVGSPTDPWSHGLMAVNQWFLGLNPVGTLAATNALDMIPFVSDYEKGDTIAGETMAELADRWGYAASEIYAINRQAFIDMFGEDEANNIFGGLIAPETVVLPEAVELLIPHSSFVENVIDPYIFPFGREDTAVGTFWSITPGWTQYALRGFGLWAGSAEDALEGGDFISSGFLSFQNNPETRASIAGEVFVAMQHLEAEYGLVSQALQAQRDFAEFFLAHEEELGAEFVGNEATIVNQQHENAAEFIRLRDRARQLEVELLDRAMKLAGGTMLLRAAGGFVAPAIPRLLYHEQEMILAYHQARELAQQDPENFSMEGYILPALSGDDETAARDAQAFRDLLAAWLAEPFQGSIAKQYLATNYPELLPFTQGKTYWGPNGDVPESGNMDRYSVDVMAGLRQPYPPAVFLQQIARSSNRYSREVDIISHYGNDPLVAASRLLQNYDSYRRLIEPYNMFTDVMDYADDFFNAGQFLDWRQRNRKETATLYSELALQAERDIDVLEEWSVNADEVLDMSPSERAEFVGNMKGVVSGIRDSIEQWRQLYPEQEYRSPRQEYLGVYFGDFVAPYYDHLADLYSQIDLATDSEARSRLYDEIRAWQNNEGMAPVYIEGQRFPSILEWWWGAKNGEEQQQQLYRWVAAKPEWMNLFAVQRLVEFAPEAADFLPDTADDMSIYDAFNEARNVLGDFFEPYMSGGDVITSGFTNSQQEAIMGNMRDVLSQWLIQNGRGGEAVWRELLPIQRLGVLNLLPHSLLPYLPQVNMIVETLTANQMSVTTNAGYELFRILYAQIGEDMQTNPRIGQDLQWIGQIMFQEDAYDYVLPRLFQGELQGEI